MNVAEEKTRSLWMDTQVAEATSLRGDESADVVVIGSGIAGLSLAYELMARGRSVMVLDRGRIGGGMTARTTAHLASALDDRYADLIRARGVEAARIVYQSQAAAINRIEAIAANEGIACDFQRVDGYLLLAPPTPSSELDEELVASLIVDGSCSWAEAYDPNRLIKSNIGQFISENITALRSFAEYLTGGDIQAVDRLRPGEGGLFRSGLKKIAACRDEQGHLHMHSAACTHMGCVVHWNSLEQCWDCPCHGSQFAPDGTPLNGPAVAPLGNVEARSVQTAE